MFISEVEVFNKGIKPGLLVGSRFSSSSLIGQYFWQDLGRPEESVRRLYTREPVVVRDNIEIGKALGYFPGSCERFREKDPLPTILWFHGISFNVKGLREEAVEWCLATYESRILEEYGFLVYSFRCGRRWEAFKIIGDDLS